MVSTNETAAILGVSRQRVQHLIKSGRLEAVKVGRDWVVDADSIYRHQLTAGKRRPMSEATAWLLADVLDGISPDTAHQPTTSRALARFKRATDPRQVVRWMERRYLKTVKLASNTKTKDAAFLMDKTWASGDSLLCELGANFSAWEDGEIVVAKTVANKFVKELRLIPWIPGSPHLIVHVVGDEKMQDHAETPRLIAYCDLAESSDPRTRHFGLTKIEELIAEVKQNER